MSAVKLAIYEVVAMAGLLAVSMAAEMVFVSVAKRAELLGADKVELKAGR